MPGNKEISDRLKEIVPYSRMYRLSWFELVNRALLRNKDVLLSILPQIEPIVRSDDDYYLYLCLSAIVKTAKNVINNGEGDYKEIIKHANVVYNRYDKRELIGFIDSDLSRVLHPKCPNPHASEEIIKENIMQISDKSMEWLIDNYLMYMADRRVGERIQCKEPLVDALLLRTMKANIYEDRVLTEYCKMVCGIYEEACKRPLFDDFKKDFIEKCKTMVDKINELDRQRPVLHSNLLELVPLLKKMNVKEVRYVEKVLNDNEKEIEYVMKYREGQVFSFDYNMSEQLKCALKGMSLEKFLFSLTHISKWLSVFDAASKVFFPRSVNYTNNYFTRRRQTDIRQKIEWYSSFYHPICGDPVIAEEYLSIKESQVSYLRERGVFNDEAVEEILCMYSFTSHILRCRGSFQCMYGTCMNILTMTEKLLRIIVDKDNSEILIDLNLQELFEKANMVLGEKQRKGLYFFVSHTDNSEEMSKFGGDYRNRLAHWTNIQMDQVNNILIGKLLFVFESVFNSLLFWHGYPWEV